MLPVKYSRNDRYMEFLSYCRTKIHSSEIVTHQHHIQPEYDGGPTENWNLVRLSVEDHITAHRILWEEFGNYEDLGAIGILGKSKHLTKSEWSVLVKLQWKNMDQEQKTARAKKGNATRTPEQKSQIANYLHTLRSKESKSAGAIKMNAMKSLKQRKAIAIKANASRTPEQRREISRKANAAKKLKGISGPSPNMM